MDIQDILKLPQGKNLTGNQIVEVLDSFLDTALINIFNFTNLGKKCCASIMSQSFFDKRRKIAGIESNEFNDNMYNLFFSLNNPYSYYKSSKLERTISTKIITLFLDLVSDYSFKEDTATNHIYYNKLNTTVKHLGISIIKAKTGFDYYLKFKDIAMQKFYRVAYKYSLNKYHSSKTDIDIDDLFKTMVIAISVGIDKYREDKGSLSSFIQWQFKHYILNPEFDYEYGQAISINKVTKLNISKAPENEISTFALELDDNISDTKEDESDELENTVQNNECNMFLSIIKNIPDVDFALEVLGLDKLIV